MRLEGMILKGIGGLYTVLANGETYTCRARGIFRKRGIVPTVGDKVAISVEGDAKNGEIEEIFERKNSIIRPPLANLDRLFVVASMLEPSINLYLIDKMTAVAKDKDIEPVLIITKADLDDPCGVKEIYEKAGIKCFISSIDGTDHIDELLEMMKDGNNAFSGNSGVGKSTIMNRLLPDLEQETGDISKKLGRGRHTTRQVELFPLPNGGFLADTPGFSTLDVERYEKIRKENLAFCFPEFAEHIGNCKFTSCTHCKEKGCAIIQAVEDGKIAKSRHASYIAMYDEAKEIKDWEWE